MNDFYILIALITMSTAFVSGFIALGVMIMHGLRDLRKHMDEQFGKMSDRLDATNKRIDTIAATMVTKEQLKEQLAEIKEQLSETKARLDTMATKVTAI